MAAMKRFYEELARLLNDGETVAVASIAKRLGSAPRSQGARCAVKADGSILGTIGGGLMERRTQEAGVLAIADNRVHYLKMRLDSKELAASGMICGGSVDIAVVPWRRSEVPLAGELLRTFMENRKATLITHWDEAGEIINLGLLGSRGWTGRGPLGEEAKEAAAEADSSGKPVFRGKAGKEGLLAEPIERERSPLVILGAGHVGAALLEVASFAGFSVTIVDDREEFADPRRHPKADRVLCIPFEGALAMVGADDSTFIVICTRGHLSDTVCIEEAMAGPPPYVGLIGSRRKTGMVLRHLREKGVDEERLSALHSPVGLDIGSETPEEIAVSITAQMIAVKRGVGIPA